MNICYLCSEYPLPEVPHHGGVGTFVQMLGRDLVKRGHKVFVLGFYPSEGVSEDQGVQVLKLRPPHWPTLNLFPMRRVVSRIVNALIREPGLHLIEASEGTSAFLPHSPDLPTVIRLHGGHHFFCHFAGVKTRFHRAVIERYCLRRTDFLVGVSRFVAAETWRLAGISRTGMPIIPNPVDVSTFCPRDGAKVRKRTIVFAGTIVRKKGIHELIEAMPIIQEELPEARLLVAGRDAPIPRTTPTRSTKEFLEKSMDARTRRAVTFLGHVRHSEIADLYRQGEVCVFPSHMESQGIVVGEAMACGRPVIFSKTGPGPEIIEDGVSGLLCDPYDPKDIADKIIRVLKDPELAARLGRNARKRVEEHFSAEVIVPKNIAFYEECIERFKRGETDRQRTFWRL